jgi:hypothetical protein
MCGTTLPASEHKGGQRKRFCLDCTGERRKARQNVGTKARECDQCGASFQPYKGDQKRCDKAECRAKARQASNRRAAGSGVILEDGEVFEKRAERDEQMEKLFRYYKSKENIVYDRDVADGSRLLVIPDIQFPFVDEPLLAAFLRFVQDWKPHFIIDVGDLLDAYEISSFDKRPSRLFNLEDETTMASDFINDVRRRSAVGNLYFHIDGNHEQRMQQTIWRMAQQFSFMVKDIPEAMGLEKITDGFVPYGKHVEFHGFVMTHGTIVRAHSAYTAKAMMDKYRSSGASGHTHRIGDHSITDHRDVSHTWYEVGCLCRKDLEYVKASANWQHGFLIATVYKNALHPHLVRVVETSAGRGFVVEGSYYAIHDKAAAERAA